MFNSNDLSILIGFLVGRKHFFSVAFLNKLILNKDNYFSPKLVSVRQEKGDCGLQRRDRMTPLEDEINMDLSNIRVDPPTT